MSLFKRRLLKETDIMYRQAVEPVEAFKYRDTEIDTWLNSIQHTDSDYERKQTLPLPDEETQQL